MFIFTSGGSPGSSGNGEFQGPSAIAIDPRTLNVYVADTLNHRIQKFSSNGLFITKWGSFGTGIGQFDNTGRHITSWGSLGTGNYQVNLPEGIAVDSNGNVFVADTGNHRISKFDNNGVWLASWGSRGNRDGEFSVPGGVAVDSSGNVFVADRFNTRIQKFDNNGLWRKTWGTEGYNIGQFKSARDITVNPNTNNVFVLDSFNPRVQEFDNDGKFIRQWGTSGTSNGCHINSEYRHHHCHQYLDFQEEEKWMCPDHLHLDSPFDVDRLEYLGLLYT